MTEKRTVRDVLENLIQEALYGINGANVENALSEIQEIQKAEVMGVEDMSRIIDRFLVAQSLVAYSETTGNKIATALHAEMVRRVEDGC